MAHMEEGDRMSLLEERTERLEQRVNRLLRIASKRFSSSLPGNQSRESAQNAPSHRVKPPN